MQAWAAEHLEWTVSPEEAGSRLDRFLASRDELGTRSQAQRLIEGGYVQLEGRPAKAGSRLRAGLRVSVERPPPPKTVLEPEAIELDPLHEDASILVINKPAGLVVHPAPGHRSGTLVNALLYRWGGVMQGLDPLRPGIVHRLDKDTSGALVVAKDVATLEALARQFRNREVGKRYLALAWGKIRPARGVIEGRIGRDRVHRKRMSVQARGREAITRYEVLEVFDRCSLVRLHPETGRTHQIRVHLAAMGHPIVADKQYARGRHGKIAAMDRQALHAESITFRHPDSGESMTVSAPLAPDFAGALSRLRETRLTDP